MIKPPICPLQDVYLHKLPFKTYINLAFEPTKNIITHQTPHIDTGTHAHTNTLW